MNCDRIAPFYRWLEWIAFGRQLQRCRIAFLPLAKNKKTALVLGDGDGRFLEALANAYPALEIDCIEISTGMLAQARRRRIGTARLYQADAFQFSFETNRYDLVFSHFLLDCFETPQVAALIRHVSPALRDDAVWILSEFSQARGWRNIYTSAWLKIMYWFFRLFSDLQTQSLPDYRAAFISSGFCLEDEKTGHLGMIVSQLWMLGEACPNGKVVEGIDSIEEF